MTTKREVSEDLWCQNRIVAKTEEDARNVLAAHVREDCGKAAFAASQAKDTRHGVWVCEGDVAGTKQYRLGGVVG